MSYFFWSPIPQNTRSFWTSALRNTCFHFQPTLLRNTQRPCLGATKKTPTFAVILRNQEDTLPELVAIGWSGAKIPAACWSMVSSKDSTYAWRMVCPMKHFQCQGWMQLLHNPGVESIMNYETSLAYRKFFKGNETKKLWIWLACSSMGVQIHSVPFSDQEKLMAFPLFLWMIYYISSG